MKNTFQRGGVIVIVLVTALSAGFLWGFYLPERSAAANLRKEISTLQHDIQRVPIRIAELESLKAEIKLREEFLKSADTWMLRNGDVSTVLSHVSRLAGNSHLKVTRLEPKTPVKADSYRSLPFRVTFEGSFTGIAAFVKGLESHDCTIHIEEFSLRRIEEDRPSPIQADVHFSVFTDSRDFTDSAGNHSSGITPAADTRIR